MKRIPRPKTLDAAYGWCSRPNHGIIFKPGKCLRCAIERERSSEGLCCAKLGHGPGHQSTTYCQEKGKHRVHRCVYGCFDQTAEWTGPAYKIRFTGYFDDAPRLD